MGPGVSARSHTANEFIYLKEVEEGNVPLDELLDKIKKLRDDYNEREDEMSEEEK